MTCQRGTGTTEAGREDRKEQFRSNRGVQLEKRRVLHIQSSEGGDKKNVCIVYAWCV